MNSTLTAKPLCVCVLYVHRPTPRRQARQDRLSNLEYERALKEFYVLDDSVDKAAEEALDLSLSQR